jgi:hypothetical protein
LKSCAPLDKRLLAKITPVQLEEIEAIDARRRIPPVQQRKKVGLAVAAGGNQLAIDDAGLCREPEDRGGDRWEATRKVSPILTVDRRGETRFVKLDAVSRRISVHTTSPRPSEAML